MALTLQTLSFVAGIALFVGILGYRKALPQPIPGILYNPDATKRLLGDAPDFMKYYAETSELYSWLASQCEKMRSPVIQLFMRPFGKPWVVVADFTEAQDIMARRSREFDRSDYFGDLFKAILPYSHLHMRTGAEWRAHRKLIGDVISPDFVENVSGPQIYKTVLHTIDLWKQKARLAKGRPFSVTDDVSYAALDAIWSATFGSETARLTKSQLGALTALESIDLSENADSLVDFPSAPIPPAAESIIKLTKSVEIATSSPFPRQHHWLAVNLYPSLRAARRRKDEFFTQQLNDAWRRFSADTEKNDDISSALDMFVHREVQMAKKDARQPQYDTPAIRDELFTLLLAGHDTTGITLCWGLKYLTVHQEVQTKLRAALHEHIPQAFRNGRLPTIEEITHADVPYLDATVEEIHRLGGTAPCTIRVATCNTSILGHAIPQGTDVFLLSQGPGYISAPLHVDDAQRNASSTEVKSRYGSWDPTEISQFKPERWLVSDSNGKISFNPWAGPAHPFGAGPRGCFGRRLASLELKILWTLVVWSFELQQVPELFQAFSAQDVTGHVPKHCILRLSETR